MLDPCHKHLGFVTPSTRMISNTKLLELANSVDTTAGVTTGVDMKADVIADDATPWRKSATASAMAVLLGDKYSTRQNDVGAEVESPQR